MPPSPLAKYSFKNKKILKLFSRDNDTKRPRLIASLFPDQGI